MSDLHEKIFQQKFNLCVHVREQESQSAINTNYMILLNKHITIYGSFVNFLLKFKISKFFGDFSNLNIPKPLNSKVKIYFNNFLVVFLICNISK